MHYTFKIYLNTKNNKNKNNNNNNNNNFFKNLNQ